MESNKKYRPLSYSEGYIDKLNHVNYNLKLLDVSNNWETEILEVSTNSTQVSVNSADLTTNSTDLTTNSTDLKIIDTKLNNSKNSLYFFYKRAITFTFHLLLIAFFEIIFFLM